MPVLGVEEARIRYDSDQWHDKTAKIYTPSSARSSSGGTTFTYPATPTYSSPGQVAPTSKDIDAWYAEKLGGRQGFVISLRTEARVTANDRIVIDGRTFEVIGHDRGRSYHWRQRVIATELK